MGRIIVEISDRIATATISAPPMNALDAAMRDDLAAQIEKLERDDQVGAILLRGDGPRAFCAGFDLKELPATAPSAEITRSRLDHDAILFDRLEQCHKPSLALVEGVAFGGGLELAACCDFILASQAARFALPEIKIGAIPGAGGTVRVTRQIGPARARQMILLGEAIDAETARDWGLIARVVPADELAKEGAVLAKRLAAMPARAMQYAKRAILAAQTSDDRAASALARKYAAQLSTSADLTEGVRAFLERRNPVFTDRIDTDL